MELFLQFIAYIAELTERYKNSTVESEKALHSNLEFILTTLHNASGNNANLCYLVDMTQNAVKDAPDAEELKKLIENQGETIKLYINTQLKTLIRKMNEDFSSIQQEINRLDQLNDVIGTITDIHARLSHYRRLNDYLESPQLSIIATPGKKVVIQDLLGKLPPAIQRLERSIETAVTKCEEVIALHNTKQTIETLISEKDSLTEEQWMDLDRLITTYQRQLGDLRQAIPNDFPGHPLQEKWKSFNTSFLDFITQLQSLQSRETISPSLQQLITAGIFGGTSASTERNFQKEILTLLVPISDELLTLSKHHLAEPKKNLQESIEALHRLEKEDIKGILENTSLIISQLEALRDKILTKSITTQTGKIAATIPGIITKLTQMCPAMGKLCAQVLKAAYKPAVPDTSMPEATLSTSGDDTLSALKGSRAGLLPEYWPGNPVIGILQTDLAAKFHGILGFNHDSATVLKDRILACVVPLAHFGINEHNLQSHFLYLINPLKQLIESEKAINKSSIRNILEPFRGKMYTR